MYALAYVLVYAKRVDGSEKSPALMLCYFKFLGALAYGWVFTKFSWDYTVNQLGKVIVDGTKVLHHIVKVIITPESFVTD